MFHRFEALGVLNFCVLQVSQALGVETLSAPASEGRVSMGIRVFSHARIYEKLAVYQRVGLVSIVLRLRPNMLATARVLGDSLHKHILCNDFWDPAATSLYAAWPCGAAIF